MRLYLILTALVLTGCSQNISHEAIQDAYSACGNHNGLSSMRIEDSSATAYCENGHNYAVPKQQLKKKPKDKN